jgi:hypothetical protein
VFAQLFRQVVHLVNRQLVMQKGFDSVDAGGEFYVGGLLQPPRCAKKHSKPKQRENNRNQYGVPEG